MRLDEFVKIKEREAQESLRFRCPYGLDREGSIMNRWQANFGRIELYTRYRGFDDVSPGRHIQVRVPRTEAGADPMDRDEQPYGWDGKINEYAAEAAVWHAFEIFTDAEAADFYRSHHPVVIFEYLDQGKGNTLTVQNCGEGWMVVSGPS